MEISGEHRFDAPRPVVWESLLDPAALKASMPGCERLDPTGPESYDLTIKVGIAAIKGTYSGHVTVTDRNPQDSYRLVVDGSGKPGRVQGDAVLTLTEDGAGTRVTYQGDVKAQGAIARLGSRLLAGSAKLMIGQFFKAMDKQVEQRVA
ncbi:MAG TPA: carbon monoxide dehydrogenase subunit G [Tepidiformaceae bacterium]|nr:carbon monoxide dehydrogenase subunit G [Tepidiformaceae bacterium]